MKRKYNGAGRNSTHEFHPTQRPHWWPASKQMKRPKEAASQKGCRKEARSSFRSWGTRPGQAVIGEVLIHGSAIKIPHKPRKIIKL